MLPQPEQKITAKLDIFVRRELMQVEA